MENRDLLKTESQITETVFSLSNVGLFVVQVIMWIHGGGLAAGGALQYDGSPLAACQNVVVVVIQYRLSILGFLRHVSDSDTFNIFGLSSKNLFK